MFYLCFISINIVMSPEVERRLKSWNGVLVRTKADD